MLCKCFTIFLVTLKSTSSSKPLAVILINLEIDISTLGRLFNVQSNLERIDMNYRHTRNIHNFCNWEVVHTLALINSNTLIPFPQTSFLRICLSYCAILDSNRRKVHLVKVEKFLYLALHQSVYGTTSLFLCFRNTWFTYLHNKPFLLQFESAL